MIIIDKGQKQKYGAYRNQKLLFESDTASCIIQWAIEEDSEIALSENVIPVKLDVGIRGKGIGTKIVLTQQGEPE